MRRLSEWAARTSDVEAVALVGSWARGAARADCDVDVLIITNQTDLYVSTDAWAASLGITQLREPKPWGALTERRGTAPSGLEVEVGITTAAWANLEPVDPGTRRVVSDGIKAIYDPRGMLARLVRAAR